ncbi:MAG: HD domain-containing phosphohydrolase, partial [Actinomycetota bacterium]
FQDITRRRKAEEETRRLNRALQTLSKANEVLIRAEDEEELLDNVCRIIVDVGCYGLTWVGYAEDDTEKSVRVVAHAGGDAAFIKEFRPSWADNEFGQNPAGFAIREGQPKFIAHDDISRSAGGWKAAAADCGYAECLAFPLVVDAAASGALCICSTEAGIFTRGETRLLAELADDLAFGISSLRSHRKREHAEKELKLNLARLKKVTAGVTKALATAAEVRDPYTAGHQQRVTDLAVAIAGELKLTDDQIDFIRTGGTLHDVGKISVPAEILTNPRKLTTLELGMVKEHSQYSYEILKEAEFPWPVADMVAQHHERLDGSGYPKGLKGDEIMLEAKILAVADVVEAMSSHRPYRPALGIGAAMEEISVKRGKLYDREVVDACLRLLKEKKFSFGGVT